MTRQVQIQQCLHGYRDGHELLASSVRMDRDTRAELLLLTDLSGPQIVPGFESYISGFPVHSGDYYALACTWYAPEQPRPGCAWTHTLLLPNAYLGVLEDASPLVEMFRRPVLENVQSGDGLQCYAEPLRSSVDSPATPGKPDEHEVEVLAKLLSQLYGEPSRALAIAANSSTEYLQMVLRTWLGLWPEARLQFRFRTGSLARSPGIVTAFDVEVMPQSSVAHFARDPKMEMFLAHEPAPEWAVRLAQLDSFPAKNVNRAGKMLQSNCGAWK